MSMRLHPSQFISVMAASLIAVRVSMLIEIFVQTQSIQVIHVFLAPTGEALMLAKLWQSQCLTIAH